MGTQQDRSDRDVAHVNFASLFGKIAEPPLAAWETEAGPKVTSLMLDHPFPDANGRLKWAVQMVEIPALLAEEKEDILKTGEVVLVVGYLIGPGELRAARIEAAALYRTQEGDDGSYVMRGRIR